MAHIELEPLGTITAQLGEQIDVGAGPKGHRLVVDVIEMKLETSSFSAELAVNDAADWATLSDDGTLASLDVRATLKTDDGAYIYVEYGGRMDMGSGLLATAPTFQAADERYTWLNRVQAVAAGEVNLETGVLVYTLYVAKPVAG